MARKPKKKAKGIKVDFSESASYFRPVQEMLVLLKITNVEENDSSEVLNVDFELLTGGRYKGKTIRDFLPTEGGGVFRLRNLLEALGQDIGDGEEDIDFEELVDQEVAAKLSPYEYEGKDKVKFTYFPAEEFEDEEDDKSAKSSRKSKDEEEEDEEPKRGKKSRTRDDDDDEPKSRKSRKSRDDDEEEEENEAPASRGKKGKKKAALTQEAIRDMDDEELQSVIDDNDLEVDLSEFKTLKKQQNAVIDAAEEAGLIDE